VSYYREDEVGRLIVNWWQWNGDGVAVRTCAKSWAEDSRTLMRDVRRTFRSSLPVAVVGVDARKAGAALVAIRAELSRALRAFHLSSLTFEMQARELMHVSKSHYHRLLIEAHPAFIEAYELEAKTSAQRERATAAAFEAPRALRSPVSVAPFAAVSGVAPEPGEQVEPARARRVKPLARPAPVTGGRGRK
jgi:hypothetical protein